MSPDVPAPATGWDAAAEAVAAPLREQLAQALAATELAVACMKDAERDRDDWRALAEADKRFAARMDTENASLREQLANSRILAAKLGARDDGAGSHG